MKELLEERHFTAEELKSVVAYEIKKDYFSNAIDIDCVKPNGDLRTDKYILDTDCTLQPGDKVELSTLTFRVYYDGCCQFVRVTNVQHSMTIKEALAAAAKYGLQYEVQWCMDNGYTPEEALSEWDIL